MRGFVCVASAVLFVIGVGVGVLGVTSTGSSSQLYGPRGEQFSAAFIAYPTEFHEGRYSSSSPPAGFTPSADTFWYRYPRFNVERVDITPVSWYPSGFVLSDLTRGYLERITHVTVGGLPGLKWSEGCYLGTYCTEELVVTNGKTVWSVGAQGPPRAVNRLLGPFRPL